MTQRLGLVIGAVIAVIVGIWFIWTTAVVTEAAEPDLRLLGGAVALCFIIAVVLALAARVSPFFPSLGLGFFSVAAVVSLVCLVISGFHGRRDVALGYLAMTLTLAACLVIVAVVTPRIEARA